jgi:hypothetical protein
MLKLKRQQPAKRRPVPPDRRSLSVACSGSPLQQPAQVIIELLFKLSSRIEAMPSGRPAVLPVGTEPTADKILDEVELRQLLESLSRCRCWLQKKPVIGWSRQMTPSSARSSASRHERPA